MMDVGDLVKILDKLGSGRFYCKYGTIEKILHDGTLQILVSEYVILKPDQVELL